jgi:hypothetical protein
MEEIEGLDETLFKIDISDWFRIFIGYLTEGGKGAAKEIIRSLEEEGKLNEFKEFINNSIASGFGLFWENLNKDPEKELEQKLIEGKREILSDIDKILEERQRARLVEYKLLEIIPRKKLVMNPGREFFDELSPYASEAFKELKKMRPGDKVLEAMEKDYNAYRTSRKKKIALALLGVIAGSLAGYAIYNYFKEDRSAPAIYSVNYKFIPPDKISIAVNATDSSGVAKVLAEVQGKNYSLPLINGFYSANITDGLISEIENLPIKIYAFDKLNNCAKKELIAVPNLKEKFLSLALANQVPEQKAENFYSSYLEFVQEIFPKNPSWLIPTLKLYSANSTVFNELHRNISLDPQITMNRKELLSLASQLFLDLGYDKKVKVLIPGSGKYKEEFLTKPTIQTFGNYSIAINQLELPKHDKNTLFLLGNASQINPVITDFEPVIIKDFEGNVFVIKSKNIARDIWMIAEHLRHTPYVVNFPEMYEAFNIKVQQNAFDILDNPYGPNGRWIIPEDGSIHNPENLTASDKIIWNKVIIPQWDYYWNSTPQAGNISKRVTVFPWYNSTLSKAWIPDKTNRTIALIYLWELPAITFDKANKQVVSGTDGMKLFIKQLPKEYEEIIKVYLDPTSDKYEEAKWYYYQWLSDRFNHGLSYTVGQFVGLGDNDVRYFLNNWNMSKFIEKIEKSNGVDQSVTKNWKYWDLIKFIHGYERYAFPADEWETYRHGLPLAFKAFGIPHGVRPYSLGEGLNIPYNVDLISKGAPSVEWAVSIPNYVIISLYQKFPSSIVIGYGNYISLFSSKSGLEKDSASGIYQLIRDKKIYLWKKS